MIIIVNKNTKPEEIKEALNKLAKSPKRDLGSFYGKLKGCFGDGRKYQKSIRN